MAQNTPTVAEESDRLLVTRTEAARMLSLSTTEIDDMRRAGKLLAKKYGAKVLIPVSELRKFVDRLPYETDV